MREINAKSSMYMPVSRAGSSIGTQRDDAKRIGSSPISAALSNANAHQYLLSYLKLSILLTCSCIGVVMPAQYRNFGIQRKCARVMSIVSI